MSGVDLKTNYKFSSGCKVENHTEEIAWIKQYARIQMFLPRALLVPALYKLCLSPTVVLLGI